MQCFVFVSSVSRRFLFFFFSFLIIGLFEGKLEKYIGDSINFIVIVGIVCCVTCLIYLITLLLI